MAKKPTTRELQEQNETYLQQAAKMIPWAVCLHDRSITVPENEVLEAQDHLTVMHLIGKGFKIQTCLPDEINKKEVFDPALRERIFRDEVKVEAFVKPGERFLSQSGVTMQCIKVIGDDAILRHLGTMTKDVPTSIATIKEMLKRQYWQRLT